MKNYVGISLDTSMSMSHIALYAGRDFNAQVDAIKEGAEEFGIDTVVSVVHCGDRRSDVSRVVTNSSISAVKHIPDGKYLTPGGSTPLFKSIEELITMLEAAPDATDPGVAFILQIITDGGENVYGQRDIQRVVTKMKALMRTDRWTFSFRVPRGEARNLTALGIPAGNILEWDQTEKGVATATATTRSAFRGYYAARSAGVTATDKFYTDLSTVSLAEVKANLVDISNEVDVYVVDKKNNDVQIRDFVEAQGATYSKGVAFYELSKTETVQAAKQLAVRDKVKGHVYGGDAARDMLGLPRNTEIKLVPGQHGQYEIFVQSTSFNRKLKEGTNLMVWPAAAI